MNVLWHKGRWRCCDARCPQKTGLPHRLGRGVAQPGRRSRARRNRRDLVGKPVQRAFTRRCATVLGEPPPTPLLGIDETRFGRPRWRRGSDGRWRLVEPWETGFVDLTGQHGLLGQVDGRTSAAVRGWLAQRAAVRGWLAQRSPAWRDAVQVVAIDPCAPYAAAVRQLLPQARIAVDHFHLVMAANRAVTAVRQRVTRAWLGRRGRRIDLKSLLSTP